MTTSVFLGFSPFRSFICRLPRVSSFSLLSAVALDLCVSFVFGLFDFLLSLFLLLLGLSTCTPLFSPSLSLRGFPLSVCIVSRLRSLFVVFELFKVFFYYLSFILFKVQQYKRENKDNGLLRRQCTQGPGKLLGVPTGRIETPERSRAP